MALAISVSFISFLYIYLFMLAIENFENSAPE